MALPPSPPPPPTPPGPSGAPDPIFEYVRYAEFKRLLELIRSALDDRQAKSLVILSELPGEGRTFFVSALAMGYATLLNRRVLVLNTVEQPTDQVLRRISVSMPAASLLPTGQPVSVINRIDVLSPKTGTPADRKASISSDFQVRPYVDSVKDGYDLVLFDVCAMGIRNKNNLDPMVIARSADAAILLNSPASLDSTVLTRTRDQLAQWGVAPIGTVFNSGATR